MTDRLYNIKQRVWLLIVAFSIGFCSATVIGPANETVLDILFTCIILILVFGDFSIHPRKYEI